MTCFRGWPGLVLYAAAAVAAATPVGRGLQVAAPLLRGEDGQVLASALQDSGLLDKVQRAVNAQVALPRAVRLRLADCEVANAWYLPQQREVRLCLQLAEQVASLLAGEVEDEEQLLRAVDGSLRFMLLHEVGHALVDVLQLALTGREEDAVDQFAVWLLMQQEDGAEAVLSAASVFAGNASGGADLAAAHALDVQRYFNMVCWVYGSAPQRFSELPGDWGLPPERAAGCADEFRQLRLAWSRLLAKHAPAPKAAVAAPAAGAAASPAPASGDAVEATSHADQGGEAEPGTPPSPPPPPGPP